MKPYSGTQAVLRAMNLLKVLGRASSDMGLPELAERTGLNRTTAYRLLTALESEGMVEHGTGGEGYRLGGAILALGARALGASDLRRSARDELDALAAVTRETGTLEVLVDKEMLILDEAMGSHVVGTLPSVGTRWPAHGTSTGKVLLAFLPEERLRATLRGPLRAFTRRTITDRQALAAELARVRERGWAVSDEEMEDGFVAVAAPVYGAMGDVVAAVCVGAPAARMGQERIAQISRHLVGAAERISKRLGFMELEGS